MATVSRNVRYLDPTSGTWVPAEPIGWLEEHNRFARLVFWVRGVGHCGKPGRRG